MSKVKSLIFYLKSLIFNLKSYLCLDRLSWILLAIALALNLILWTIWFYKTPYNFISLEFATGVLLLNAGLSFYAYRKDQLAPWFLLATAVIVQIFLLVLLKQSFVLGY